MVHRLLYILFYVLFYHIKDVFNTVNSYTDIMINKSVQSFASWCKIKKVLLFNAPVPRERKKLLDTETSIRLRNVFVLKNEYLDIIIVKIHLSNALD
ncbi:hypothetical protein BDF21DRAFT_406310 [Thamnidium elegans]|nr:hypothetical protein BDF21DRAFT_406310 [Thamnidium elegans]